MSVPQFMPRDILKKANVYHMPTGDGAQSYPATADEPDITVAVVPLSAHKRALLGVDEVGTYELFADDDIDLREGDKITVDSTEYRIHNVDNYDFGGHPHKNCVIIKSQS